MCSTQPEIRCSRGFFCGYCTNTSHRRPFCDRHSYKWNELCDATKQQTRQEIDAFNGKFLPSEKARKRLQLFINRIVVRDELNRSRNSGDVILYLSRQNDSLKEENDRLVQSDRVFVVFATSFCTMVAVSMCFIERQFIRFGLILFTSLGITGHFTC